ncbi:MAG: glutamine--tRNA ligase/YqeY domain fusion protein [Trueperaceae bacterium]
MPKPTQNLPKSTIPKDEDRLVSPNFITEIIDVDLKTGKYETIITRFPPEPNGYAHIGHAVASFLNFSLAKDYNGLCRLRMDDTNPETEKQEYADALANDFAWLGFKWVAPDGTNRIDYASDYFAELYDLAVKLIKDGKAYVDSSSDEEVSILRGTVEEAGKASPYRERSVEENLDLLERMKNGEFPDGANVLRAKIDLANPNMKLRDPLLYRIRRDVEHYRTGKTWCIYPSYDFAQATTDALDGVTHSLCSLEFVDNRAIYDWLMENLWGMPRPYQYEFGRRNLEYTVVSKRKLIQLVKEGFVTGWDDPRMPTLAGLRRRGVRPEAIRAFASKVGITRTTKTVELALLEQSIRDDLNTLAPRVMAVTDPLKVVITNYPENKLEMFDVPYWPNEIPNEGSRQVPFAKEIYIEREDFAETPPPGFKRLTLHEEVRLRFAYVIRCDEVVKNKDGMITELRCSYDPETHGKNPKRKIKGAIHWVAKKTALPAEMRLYDRLFSVPNPDEGEGHFTETLNPESLVVREGFVELSVARDAKEQRYQFERVGYFVQDPDSSADRLVFNRIITLKDSFKAEMTRTDLEVIPVKDAVSKDAIKDKTKIVAKVGEVRDPVLDFSAEQKAKLQHFTDEFGLSRDEAVMIANNIELSAFFDKAVNAYANPQGIANWVVNDLRRELKDNSVSTLKFSPSDLAKLVILIDKNVISNRIAKDVFLEMFGSGKSPDVVVKEKGLEQVTDVGSLEPIVLRLIAENPDKAEAYRNGKTGLLSFFVGQAMRETSGKANPQLLQELVRSKLT